MNNILSEFVACCIYVQLNRWCSCCESHG